MKPEWFLQLIEWDKIVFLKINKDWTHEKLDKIFAILTDLHKEPDFIHIALPLILLAGLLMGGWRFFRVLLAMAIVIGVTDAFTYRVLKPMAKRPRPPYTQGLEVHLKVEKPPDGPSFPSNHAANSFAGATLLSISYPALSPLFFGIALVIAYSRPYVGVHFPLDVLFGMLVGWCFARILYSWIFRRMQWWNLKGSRY